MARTWVSGAELQSLTAGVEVAAVTGSVTIETTASKVRSGLASYQFAASGSEASLQVETSPASADDFFRRVYVMFDSFPASLTKIIQLQDAGGDHTSIRINS